METPATAPASASAAAKPATGSITFIGNATMLISWGGFNILTDPAFNRQGEQTWLGYGLHTTRLTNPAMTIGQLPKLDLVLLSHFHGDHFDETSERELDHSLPIATTETGAEALRDRGFANARGLDPWTSMEMSKDGHTIRITSIPGRHGPPMVDIALPDVMGSVIEFMSDTGIYTLYITGDTLIIDELSDVGKRFPKLDAAILHLGGTRVMGVTVTMDADMGIELLDIVKPPHAIAIHYNDWDVFKSPLEDFLTKTRETGWADRVTYLEHGAKHSFSA
jgi:L-ascorbate metabolism protein UlaG (beta-lactamase superfamily)